MAKGEDLENIFSGIKVNPTKLATEFGLFYDAKTNSYWFGEKERVKK